MQCKQNVNVLKYLLVTVALLLTIATLFGVSQTSQVAYADDSISVVFPTAGYIQSEDPTLIAANDNYLLVYDETQNRLYVRSNTTLGNYDYATDFFHVTNLLAVGDKAFFVADDHYFSIDLTDKTATAQEAILSTPDDISYITTDGKYLYCKSDYGFITIYDDDFGIAFSTDNVKNPALAGPFAILGNDSTIYIFSTDYGFPKYKILDLASTDPAVEYSISSNVQTATYGDVIFALVGGRINCLDKDTGADVLATEIEPDDFASYGKNLFTIEGGTIKIYTLSQDGTALEFANAMTMTGSDANHLNNPVDIEKMPNKYAIADANNNRIAYFSGTNELTSFSLDTTPKRLAHDGNILYIACENQILKLNSLYIEQRYDMADVIDILYLDKLYVLKSDGIYVLFSGEFVKFYDIENAICLASMQDGSNVFIGTEQEIVVIDSTGAKLPTTLTGDFTGLKDIAVDYAGNVVLAYESKVEVFSNNIDSLNFVATTALAGDLRATLTACVLDGTDLYFTTSESYVGKAALDVVTKDSHSAPSVQPSENYILKQSTEGSHILPADQRNGNIKNSKNEVLMAFESATAPQGYALAYDGIDYLYIPETALEDAECEDLNGEYVATKQTVLFVTPNKDSSDNVIIDEGEHVIFKRGTAGFDGGNWVVVEYQGSEYFARTSDYSEYVPPVPERRHTYGRAKGNRVGGIVNVYQSASTESAVILELADGAKVEILETLDDFYKVSYNGTVGYMTKDEVQLGGLTTVQIVAIVLAILVLLAGTTVFTAIYFTKKKQADNE